MAGIAVLKRRLGLAPDGPLRVHSVVAIGFLVVVLVLVCTSVANAADGAVSYTDPSGGTSQTRGGTSRFQADPSVGVWVEVGLYTGGNISDPGTGFECGPGDPPCDTYTPVSGTDLEATLPCEYEGSEVICPDASNFVANLGNGTNDFSFQAPLEYETALVNGGSGADAIVATTEKAGSAKDESIFNGNAGEDNLIGGPGNDTLRGGAGNDSLNGEGGDDKLYGEGDNDTIFGGPGNDLEVGGEGRDGLGYGTGPDEGADTFEGGGGSSTVSYAEAGGPVNVTLDGAANDGQPGEGDNVMPSVSVVTGSGFGDTLVAGHTPVTLSGFGGNDTIYGGSGGGTLVGGEGNDTIYTAGPAGAGPDSVFGDNSECSLSLFGSCPAGNDTIFAADGVPDQINCGPGADLVHADQLDVVATDPINGCESVSRELIGAAPVAHPSAPPAPTVTFAVLKAPHSVRALIKSGLTLQARCASACKLSARASIGGSTARRVHLSRGKPVVIGSGHAALLSAGVTKLKVSLGAKAKRALAHLRKFSVTVKLTVTGASGAATSATKTINV